MAQRQRLQSSIAALTRSGSDDPRYAVAPMADRRAEFSDWSAARDSRRPPARPPAPPAQAAEHAAAARSAPGDTPPALRPTAGEAVPQGSVVVDPRHWMSARDAAAKRPAAPVERVQAAQEVGRALRDLGAVGRQAAAPRDALVLKPPLPVPVPELLQRDALARRATRPQERMLKRARKPAEAAAHALQRARSAIPDAWAERARERIPGLGRADPYVRESARKLLVAVGTVDELTEKADQLREQAQAVRELQAADAANDDARRDRALDRLKARRLQEDA